MKSKTAQEQLLEYRESLIERLEHWKYISKNGCNDPFWEDGCNMNLTRGHSIYYKGEISRICEENGLALPEEYYSPTPPKVDDHYMARLDQEKRVQRFQNEGRKLTTKKTEYDEAQLSLF